MPKSGKKRRARRGALSQAETARQTQEELWEGNHRENVCLVKKAFRWPTEATAKEFDDIPDHKLSGIDLATSLLVQAMLAAKREEIEMTTGLMAAGHFIRQEGQNQADQADTAPPLQQFFTLSSGASDAEYRQWQREKDIIEEKKRDDKGPSEDPA